jgi:hypothetical protein
MSLARRDFLSSALLLPTLFRQTSSARFLESVPLVAPGDQPPPFGRLLGDGLDARLFTDLSTLAGAPRTPHDAPLISSNAPRTSSEAFFVRTAFPRTLTRTDPWSIAIGGLAR